MNINRTLLALATAGAVSIGADSALAYPSNLIGVWTLEANLTELDLTIFSQGSGPSCVAIEGFISPHGSTKSDSNVQGYYCPTTGAISFLRKKKVSNNTFQVYSGALDGGSGPHDFMSGIFTSYDPSGPGEYSFEAGR
jgi:hypothetical protein